MPNKPAEGSRRRSFLVPDELWVAAVDKARSQGDSLSAIIRTALEQYLKEK